MTDATPPRPPLRLLLVDDEAWARQRLRDLLDDLQQRLPTVVVGEAGDGHDALKLIDGGTTADVALVDVRMPGLDGIALAERLAQRTGAPAVIFVTAHDDKAVQAFDLAATDYLLKPVRAERLLTALQKVVRHASPAMPPPRCLRSTERGQLRLIPLDEVIYLRSEDKYVLAQTRHGSHLIEESLSRLEEEHAGSVIRIHRGALAMRSAIVGVCPDPDNAGHRLLMLRDTNERLPISRRQWPAVKALIDAISGQRPQRSGEERPTGPDQRLRSVNMRSK